MAEPFPEPVVAEAWARSWQMCQCVGRGHSWHQGCIVCGHSLTLAQRGREGVGAWEAHHFDPNGPASLAIAGSTAGPATGRPWGRGEVTNRGPVAQWTERHSTKVGDQGSNPCRPAVGVSEKVPLFWLTNPDSWAIIKLVEWRGLERVPGLPRSKADGNRQGHRPFSFSTGFGR